MTEVPRYINQAMIADELGVTRAAVTNWKRRYPGSTPDPAAYVGDMPLWRPAQIDEWRAFKKRREMTYTELVEHIKTEHEFTELVQLGQEIEAPE